MSRAARSGRTLRLFQGPCPAAAECYRNEEEQEPDPARAVIGPAHGVPPALPPAGGMVMSFIADPLDLGTVTFAIPPSEEVIVKLSLSPGC